MSLQTPPVRSPQSCWKGLWEAGERGCCELRAPRGPEWHRVPRPGRGSCAASAPAAAGEPARLISMHPECARRTRPLAGLPAPLRVSAIRRGAPPQPRPCSDPNSSSAGLAPPGLEKVKVLGCEQIPRQSGLGQAAFPGRKGILGVRVSWWRRGLNGSSSLRQVRCTILF